MWKFIGVFVLIMTSFALGFYFGQRPVGTLQDTVSDLRQSVKEMSRNVIDTTMGIEQDLRRRQALLETKSKVVQAKSELLDKNFGEAAKQLADGVAGLEGAIKGAKSDHATQDVRALVGKLQEIRLELSMGKPIAAKKLGEIQQDIDRQLNK
ncbi:conserved exported protein of unknown function [Nitrospira sp. KM1]|uniref:hypothetical protein n=1 Tax=Nitrospira sp. KM1 TaxID=1936990 RepID=UPI0013A76EBB|nr:hypothetical protein [Nitrospira sp. KM1]BCA56706.1 conserved exported protein of unknown function [Nitrospira sp. KM1]